ncbi:MAG: hypothetical protein QW035_00975 [Candidatus Anstonellales archaeon]
MLEAVRVLVIEPNEKIVEQAMKGISEEAIGKVRVEAAKNIAEAVSLFMERNYHYVLSSLFKDGSIDSEHYDYVLLSCLVGKCPVAFLQESNGKVWVEAISSDGVYSIIKARKSNEGKAFMLKGTVDFKSLDASISSHKAWAEAFRVLRKVELDSLEEKGFISSEQKPSSKTQKLNP